MLIKRKGFTLVELMIVVVVIGVLSAIALPLYSDYVIRSQLVAAYAELNKARPKYEVIMNNGANPADFNIANLDIPVSSEFCNFIVHAPVSGVSLPALECQLQNVSTIINGESVYLNRQAAGDWMCSVSLGISNKYKPISCI